MRKNSFEPETPEKAPDRQDDVDCSCEDDSCPRAASNETETSQENETAEDCCCCW